MNEQEVLALVGLLNYSWYEEYVDYLTREDKSNHVYSKMAVLLELLCRVDEAFITKETIKIINDLKTDIAMVMIRDSVSDHTLS